MNDLDALIAERDKKTPEERQIVRRTAEALLGGALDNPEGFSHFYYAIHGRDMPAHGRRWIRKLYTAHRKNKGAIVEAFRGSTKTTIVTITYTAFRIGHCPQESNLLIQVGDDIAADNTGAVADIIANNPYWRIAFPAVEPDREKGWGTGGYEVKRVDVPYEIWRGMNSTRKDPTLVGVGYKSREIIGKHPTGILVVDDILDENNTSSARELDTVLTTLTGTIFPTIVKGAYNIFIGTPWTADDVLNYVASTGEYEHVRTPLYREDGNGKRYAWPGEWSDEREQTVRSLSGSRQFARMYLLDLSKANLQGYKYMTYPNSEIRFNWPMAGGVDYASNRDPVKVAAGRGDYFAMCYLAKLPGGGAVVVDGVLERLSQAQAEIYVKRAQEMFPGWLQSGVEAVGKGDDFVQTIMRNPGLRIIPMHSGRLAKNVRFERELAPWLENGFIRISDANTPFLNELRKELDEGIAADHDDARDSLYYAAKMMPDVLVMPKASDALPEYGMVKEKAVSPFAAFGRR